MMLARALGLADEEESVDHDSYAHEEETYGEEEDKHRTRQHLGVESATKKRVKKKKHVLSVEELYVGDSEDVGSAYDRLTDAFEKEHMERTDEMEALTAEHKETMRKLWDQRDEAAAMLEVKRKTAEDNLLEIEKKLTADLHDRVHKAFSSKIDTNHEALTGLGAETQRQTAELEELRRLYGALVKKLQWQRSEHAQKVAQAAEEALKKKKAEGEVSVTIFLKEYETKTRGPLVAQIAQLRDHIDGGKAAARSSALEADRIRFRADLKASEDAWLEELEKAGTEIDLSHRRKNEAEVREHTHLSQRLHTDLEEVEDRSAREAIDLERLRAEYKARENEETARDTALRQRLDDELKAFRLQCAQEDARQSDQYEERIREAVKKAIDSARRENEMDRQRYDRITVVRRLQVEVDEARSKCLAAERRAKDTEAKCDAELRDRRKALQFELDAMRQMQLALAAEDDGNINKSSHGAQFGDDASKSAAAAAQNEKAAAAVLELRRDASALREAVAQLERTLHKERELHPIRLRFLNTQIRDKERAIELARTRLRGAHTMPESASGDQNLPRELQTAEIYKHWRRDRDLQRSVVAPTVASSSRSTDYASSKQDALIDRARIVAKELGIVEAELASTTHEGHRRMTLKERRDTLEREARVLGRIWRGGGELVAYTTNEEEKDFLPPDNTTIHNNKSRAELAREAQARRAVLEDEIKTMQTMADSIDFESSEYDQIVRILQQKRFVDLTFLPADRPSVYPMPNDRGPALSWIRALDILGTEKHPAAIFDAAIEPNDIQQGKLGDCWLVCALAAVAEFPELVRALYPLLPSYYTGLYRVRVCAGGIWRTITVDDYLPCDSMSLMPRFSRAHGPELWVLLFEKAMAKLHGGYYRLRAGLAGEGLWDITGLPTFQMPLNHPVFKHLCETGDAFKYLVFADQHRAIACASTPGEDTFTEGNSARTNVAEANNASNGLVPGHAYSLLSAVDARNHKLVRLRNPWGTDLEWNGAWSDDDPRWNDSGLKHEIAAQIGCGVDQLVVPRDGTFWMCFDDFLKHFTTLTLTVQQSVSGKAWQEYRTPGYLTPDDPAELYVLHLQEPGHVYVSLHQTDERKLGAPAEYLDLGLTIVKRGHSGDNDAHYTFHDAVPPTVDRQIVCPSMMPDSSRKDLFSSDQIWPAGEYIICAYTTGTVFSSKTSSAAWPSTYDPKFMLPVTREIYARFQVDPDSGTSFEIDAFLSAAGLSSNKEYAQLSPNGDSTVSLKGLGDYLAAHPHWKKILTNLGFGPPIEAKAPPTPQYARPVALAVHSDVGCELYKTMDNDELIEEAQEMPILHRGKRFAYGQVEIYVLATTKSVSVLGLNTNPTQAISVRVDASRSRNCKSHAGKLDRTMHLPPGEAKIVHHLSRLQRGKAWGFSYTVTSSPA